MTSLERAVAGAIDNERRAIATTGYERPRREGSVSIPGDAIEVENDGQFSAANDRRRGILLFPRFVWWIVALTGVALALRVGFVMLVSRWRPLHGDPLYFHGLAEMIRGGRGWDEPFLYWYGLGEHASAKHPPLYPLLLAGSSFLGFGSDTGHRVFSCLVGASAIPVIAVVARRYSGDRAGVIAAAIAALYPYLWVNDVNLLSESLLAVLIAVILLIAAPLARAPALRRSILLGVAIGLAALTRSEQLLLLPFLAWPLLLRGPGSTRERVRRAGSATLATLLVLTPWIGWNLTRFDHPVLMSTNLGATLFNTNCDRLWSGDLMGWWTFLPPCPNDVTVPVTSIDESERDRRLRDVGLSYVRDHAGRAPVVMAARIGRVWGLFRPGQTRQLDEVERGKWPTWIGLVVYYPLTATAACGLVRLRRRRVSILPFIALAAVVTVTAGAFYGSIRFRVPAEVAAIVLAGVALGGRVLADTRSRPARSTRR